jgi:hypothetical protein
VRNPDQGNEDDDAFGDVCDNCPLRPGIDQTDGDGDGVGDLCDPRPDTAGERVVLFDTFTNGPGNWTARDGGVTTNGGALLPSGGRAILVNRALSLGSSNWVIDALFVVRSVSATAVFFGPGGEVDGLSNVTTCALRLTTNEGRTAIVDLNPPDTDLILTGQAANGPNVIGDRFFGRAVFSGAQLRCANVNHSSAGPLATPTILVDAAAVEVRAVLIYEQ